LAAIVLLNKAPAYSAEVATDAHFYDIPDSRISEILDDTKHRIPEIFRVPKEAKSVVGFWLKIYSKYSLYQTLIYDREREDIVYDVVDCRDLFNRGVGAIATEITCKKRISSSVNAYKNALRDLQKNPKKKFKSGSAGANVVRLWGRKSAREWRARIENFRTQAGQRNKIMTGIANADRFFPKMEWIFKKRGVPPEISRLPLVESSFNLNAVSKVDAVGVWQFLEKSATEYLVVDPVHNIDERLSPIKSTDAAARMFLRNYKLLQDWGLAIIAYNHGPKNLIQIRKKYKGANIAALLKDTKKSPLGYASRSFYAEFLAALHAEHYRDELYGMSTEPHSPEISIVKMRKPMSIFEIASLYNISLHELRVFNPDIFDIKRRLPAGTRVVIPKRVGESLVVAPQIDRGATPQATPNASRGIASDLEFIEYIK
jgi:membrane-bound lytic murein transglycosylase D